MNSKPNKILNCFSFAFHKKFSSSNLSHIFLLRCFNRNTKNTIQNFFFGAMAITHTHTHIHNIRILIHTHCNFPLSAILFFHGFCFCFGETRLRIIIFTFSFRQQAEKIPKNDWTDYTNIKYPIKCVAIFRFICLSTSTDLKQIFNPKINKKENPFGIASSTPRRGYKNAVKIFPLPHANCHRKKGGFRASNDINFFTHIYFYIFYYFRLSSCILFDVPPFSLSPSLSSSLFYALAFIFWCFYFCDIFAFDWLTRPRSGLALRFILFRSRFSNKFPGQRKTFYLPFSDIWQLGAFLIRCQRLRCRRRLLMPHFVACFG